MSGNHRHWHLKRPVLKPFSCPLIGQMPLAGSWVTATRATQISPVISSHCASVDTSEWCVINLPRRARWKTLNTSLRDPLPWLMPRLTAKDKTHPSPRSGPFLSNNVHNGVLRCRYCVNNLNSDLGYWAPRSQPQQRPSRRGRAGRPWHTWCIFIFFFALKILCLKAFDTNTAFNSAGCGYVKIKL